MSHRTVSPMRAAGPDHRGRARPGGRGLAPAAGDRRLRVIGRTAFEALVTVDDDRRHLWVNDEASRLLRVPAAEIVGQPLETFTPPEHHAYLTELWGEFRRLGELEGPFEILQGDGARQPITFRANWHYAPGEHLVAAVAAPPGAPPLSATLKLTKREREILALVAEGMSNDEIGRRLILSPATVKTHLQNVYSKLEVNDRAAAVVAALRAGLIA
jgi:DNA-binding CsgD family transcriptional regulator